MSEWLRGWILAGRLETPDALKNQDLWQQLASLSGKHEIIWEWLPGHAGHPFNERCDKLAKRASEEGERTLRVADRPAEVQKEEKVLPLAAAAAVYPVPDHCGGVVEFDADANGQLLLC